MNALLQPRETWSPEFSEYFARTWHYSGESVCRGRLRTDERECGEPAFEKTGLCPKHHEQFVRLTRESFDKRADNIREEAIERLDQLLAIFPNMPFATLENPEFAEKLPGPLKAFAERFSPRTALHLIIHGSTGKGKTSVIRAMAQRVVAKESQYLRSLSADEIVRLTKHKRQNWFESELAGAVWMPALELALDSKRHPLGQGESPLVTKAKQARILFLDDLGQELTVDRDRAVLEVLDARYREGGSRPTIANTGLTREEFQRSYGAHVYRRLAGKDSGGSSIDLYGGTGAK